MYDDDIALVKNADVTNTNQSIGQIIRSILLHDFWGQNLTEKHSHKSFRPLVTIIFHLEFRYLKHLVHLPAFMKQINLLAHMTVCCLIYIAFQRIFNDYDERTALFNATIIYAVHPIHTEVICSAVGRADLLCAIFFLLTFHKFLDIIEGLQQCIFPKCFVCILIHFCC